MATITKTPAGTWKGVVRKTGWPTKAKTFRTKRAAQDWARHTEEKMVRGTYIDRTPAERLTLTDALARYLAEVTPSKRPSTQQGEQRKARRLEEKLGAYALAFITPEIVAEYRDTRLAEGRSTDTVRLELALLSHLFNTAIREWHMGLMFNPVINVRKPSPGKGRNRRLEGDEEARLFEACDAYCNPMLGWMVRLTVATAMRAGEIQSLERGQVDLQKRTLLLTETKNGSLRTVPLTKEAVAVLQAALHHPVRPLDTQLIFWGDPGRDGKRRPYEFRPALKNALQKAKIKNLRFHDLRHEAISRLVEAGLRDQEVATISGHKSMQMLKRYTHLRAEDLVARLDQLTNRN